MKRKIKRGLLWAVLTALLLSLTACGGGGGGGGGTAQPEKAAPEVESAPEEEETPVDFLPTVGRVTESDYHYDESREANVNRMETQLAGTDEFTHELYPELSAALDALRERELATEREAFQERETALLELAEDSDETYELFGEMRSLVRRADGQAVSIVNAWREYSGQGHHGSYGYAAFNFDTQTGETIALESLLTPEGKLSLNSRIGEELDALYPDIKPGYMVADYLTDDYAFSLEPDGVTFWFNPYEIASYADGLLTVKLYFDRDADILNGECKGRNEAWFVELGDMVPYRFAADDGKFRTVEFWTNADFDIPDWLTGFSFAFDGKNVEVDYESLGAEAYYAHLPQGDYLVISLVIEGDSQCLLVYGADGAQVDELVGTGPDTFWYPYPPEGTTDFSAYGAYHTALTDPYKMPLRFRSELFGTWSASGLCRLHSGKVEYVDKIFYNTRPSYELTLKRDLTVTRLSDDDWTALTDEEVTLPAGAVARVAGTDGGDTAYFEVAEGGETFAFALSYDADADGRFVNGVNEAELFDGLIYAS